MKKSYNLIAVITLLFSITAAAQQTPRYTFWQQNLSLLNPAYVGSTEDLEVNIMSYKSQWHGVQNAPETQSITAQGSVSDDFGVGLNIISDKVFIQKEINVFANFSYRINLDRTRDLFLGLKAGGSFFNVDFTQLTVSDPLHQGKVNTFNPNFGLGALYKADKYYVSFSVPRLLKAARYEELSDGTTAEAADAMLVALGGAYHFDLNRDLVLIPAMLLQYVQGAPLAVDIAVSARFNDAFEIGTNYKLNTSVAVMAYFDVATRLQVGLSYDFVTSAVSRYSAGGPEFLLRVNL